MALITTYRQDVKMVTFLEDIDVKWISLVPQGANWTPFTRIEKSADSNGRVTVYKSAGPRPGAPVPIIEVLNDTESEGKPIMKNIVQGLQADIEATKQRIEALKAESGKPQPSAPVTTAAMLCAQIAAITNDLVDIKKGVVRLDERLDAYALQSEVKTLFPRAKSAPSGWDGVFTKGNEHQQLVAQVMKRASQGESFKGVWSGLRYH